MYYTCVYKKNYRKLGILELIEVIIEMLSW